MLSKNARIVLGAALAATLTLIAVMAVTGPDANHSMSGMDHSMSDPGHAMAGMEHSGMSHGESVTPTTAMRGVDAAFVRQMIPHHQMAIDMAGLAGRRASHRRIKALAGSVIDAQNAEIAKLRAIAKDEGIALADSPGMRAGDATTLGLSLDQMGMWMDMRRFAESDPFDRAFIDGMIPHHRGAIAMARSESSRGEDGELRAMARSIISAQTREIAQLRAWRAAWYGASTASADGDSGHSDGSGR